MKAAVPGGGAPVRPLLLIVAPEGADREALFLELIGRSDIRLRFAGSAGEAERAVGEEGVALLVASPEVPTADVNRLLSARLRHRPELPVLVVRDRPADEPPTWARRGVGVLRRPLLPSALRRSVDVVLGLAGRGPTREPSD